MTALSVLARVGDKRVAFDASLIEAVIDIGEIVPVPLAPPAVRGLAAVRSQVLTVIDVESSVDPDAPVTTRRRALVVEQAKHRYALLVDAVDAVTAPTSTSEMIPPTLGAGWARAARGTVEAQGEMSLALDIGAILTAD
jgi:purine-binding chemotaxis protein CheW